MTRAATWSTIGSDVSTLKTIGDVLANAGLDYEVEKVPLLAQMSDGTVEVPGRVATVRKGTGEVKGIVSPSYEICQNKDAFDFVKYVGDDLKFVRAGETSGGMIYVIGELPEVKILDDSFVPHVIFQNGHNGGVSLRAAVCPLRIVCQNQFGIAFRDANNSVTIRHTSQLASKMEDAQRVLRSTADYMRKVDDFAKKYVGMKVTDDMVTEILETLFPIKADASARSVSALTESREAFRRAYNADDNGNFRGTAWGLINAASDFYTHQEPGRKTQSWEENRFTYVTFNPQALMKFIELVNARVS